MAVTFCGIRHHGPGSAKALQKTLQQVKPDVILLEGPPEGQELLEHLVKEEIQLPVALMFYDPDDQDNVAFFPVAPYSPELVAVRWAFHNNVPVQFFDAPYGSTIKLERPTEKLAEDPMSVIATSMNYTDVELWWEDTFELSNHDGMAAFAAVEEVMGAVRENAPASDLDKVREAHMRLNITQAEKNYSNIVVVAGAWHLPALVKTPATKDRAVIKELAHPKVKMLPSVVPWSEERLSFTSGYGAGVKSPGWYHHLWVTTDNLVERWLSKTAGVLRKNGYKVSTASIIEASNLAQMLAILRGRHTPNLDDVMEASQSVLTEGAIEPLHVVYQELVIGERIGVVPEGVPQTALAGDLAKKQKLLRLKPVSDVSLDLREETGRARSELLHRLNILDVNWGVLKHSSSKGTFKEDWALLWQPNLSVQLALQAHYGSTVELAAQSYLIQEASGADLTKASNLVTAALLANLPTALTITLKALDQAAARNQDVESLLSALGPLSQTMRYGTARSYNPEYLKQVFSTTLVRGASILPGQASNLTDELATKLLHTVTDAHNAIMLNAEEHDVTLWFETLAKVADTGAPRLAGWCTRQLLDREYFTPEKVRVLIDKYLTTVLPSEGILWVEGLLAGSAALLLQDQHLWDVFNTWLTELPVEEFEDNLPLLRRTFSNYTPTEKHEIGDKVTGKTRNTIYLINTEQAFTALPATLALLGGQDD